MDMHFVRDIMNRDVVSKTKDTIVYEVAKLMAEKKISCVVITDKDKPIGILTERDLIKRIVVPGLDPKATKLSKIMTRNPQTVSPDTTIINAARMMKKQKIRRFVVIEDDILVGVFTETDVLNGLSEMIRHLNFKLVNTKMALEDFMTHMKSLLI